MPSDRDRVKGLPLTRSSFGSAPVTRVHTPEVHRKHPPLMNDRPRERGEPPKLGPAPADPGRVGRCDVTAPCVLFLVTSSLVALSMTAMLMIVVLHVLTGGKIFNSQKKHDAAAPVRPPFNFNP